MDQITHCWIALRSIALLEDEGQHQKLVDLLKPHVKMASVGAWLPDDADAKRGGAGSITDNHVFKIKPPPAEYKLKIGPYKVGLKANKRFVCDKKQLLDKIGGQRKTCQFLKDDESLDRAWWGGTYIGDVSSPGKHLPNRAMAMTTMMKDLLLMGDQDVRNLIADEVDFAHYLCDETCTRDGAASMYFFMLSHFLADACMPCHCDARKLAGYSEGLHDKLEHHWSKMITDTVIKDFDKDNISGSSPDADESGKNLLDKARQVDPQFGLDFTNTSIPDLCPGNDVWLEMIYVCRASFAIASIMAPYKKYAYYDEKARAPYDTVFGQNETLLKNLDQIIMHDAVLNTAIVWKHIWDKVSQA